MQNIYWLSQGRSWLNRSLVCYNIQIVIVPKQHGYYEAVEALLLQSVVVELQ